MTKKRTWTEEQKASLLKEVETNGLAETLRKHGIFPATYYSWKKKFDAQGLEGLKPQYSKKQLKAFRDLEQENALLKKLLAEKELELAMAKEVIKKNLVTRQIGRPLSATMLDGHARLIFDTVSILLLLDIVC